MGNQIIQALKDTISSGSSMDLIKEYSELSLDCFLSEGTLKDIPIVNTLYGVYKMGTTFKNLQNLKKITVFLNQLHDVPEQDRSNFLQKLEESDKFRETMFEKILIILERLDETAKAEIIGNLFKLYVMEAIDREKFLRLSGIVERAMLYDLMALHYRESRFYRDWDGIQPYNLNKESQISLSAYGLMEQFLEEKRSTRFEASGRSGTEPALRFKVSPLGLELANWLLYDLKDADFYKYLYEQIKNRKAENKS